MTNSRRVENKVALITGAGSGIGRATALLMAEEGATVLVADIDRAGREDVVAHIESAGGTARAIDLDVSDESAWARVMGTLPDEQAGLDILVNNAGISLAKSVADSTFEEWRRVMSVNLDGAFLGMKYAIAAMTPHGGGSIVNVASVSGISPHGGASAYFSSKAALRMLTKTVAIECSDAELGIRVNVVSPGGVKTPIWEKEPFFQALVEEHGGTEQAYAALEGASPSQRFFTPEEVAKTILYLASDKSAHLTGTEIVLDRGHTL